MADPEIQTIQIRSFSKGINRTFSSVDIGADQFLDIQNFDQEQIGKLVSIINDTIFNTDDLVGQVIGMGVFFAYGATPQIIVMTDGNSAIVTDPTVGPKGDSGRIYYATLSNTTFTAMPGGSPIPFAADSSIPGRNKNVTMRAANNKFYICTGVGPVRYWDGSAFYTQAGIPEPTVLPVVSALSGGTPQQLSSPTVSAIGGQLTYLFGIENEIYSAPLSALNPQVFQRYNKSTNAWTTLQQIPEAPNFVKNGFGVEAIRDGNIVVYYTISANGVNDGNFFAVYKYNKEQNAWGSKQDIMYQGVDAGNGWRVWAFMHSSYMKAHVTTWSNNIFFLTQRQTYAQFSSPVNYVVICKFDPINMTFDYNNGYCNIDQRDMTTITSSKMASTDVNNSVIYIAYHVSGELTTRFCSYDPMTNTKTNLSPIPVVMTEADSLIYAHGSGEPCIRFVRNGQTLANSYRYAIAQYDTQVAGTWIKTSTLDDTNAYSTPAIFPGGGGTRDMTMYLSNASGWCHTHFGDMTSSASQALYRYTYTYANDTSESGAATAGTVSYTQIQALSGIPISIVFTPPTATNVLYTRVYRTVNFYEVGGSPQFNRLTSLPKSGAISGNTIANPTIVTSTAHGLSTGTSITITGSNSTPTIDGVRVITKIDDNSFSVPVNVTVAGSSGTWTTSSWVDSTTGTLGPVLPSESVSPPPDNASIIAISSGRMILSGFPHISGDTDPTMVAFSNADDYETFDPVGGLEYLGRGEGSITAMVEMGLNTVAIFKGSSIYTLVGDPEVPSAFRLISREIGCPAPRSACYADNLCCFLGKAGVFTFNGSNVEDFGMNIKGDLKLLSDTQKQMACAGYFDSKYHLCLAGPTGTMNEYVYVYDFDISAWTARHTKNISILLPLCGDITRMFYATYPSVSNKIFKWQEGGTTTATPVKLETSWIDVENEYHDKQWRRILVNANIPVGANATIAWSVDKGRQSGVFNPLPGQGSVKSYMISCPEEVMGKNAKFTFTNNSAGVVEIEGIDISYYVYPRDRGDIDV